MTRPIGTRSTTATAPGARPLSPAAASVAALDALRQLTDRDRYILDVLAEHQVLTAEQIARLKFTDENTARKRLILLQRRKILDRFRDGVRPGSQAWRYTLGPVGAVIVAAARGTSTPRPGTHAERVLRLARSPRLHHLLGINEFFVCLAATARLEPGYALTWWLNEKRATAACAGSARPDGLGTWTHHRAVGHRSMTFFLEHDTGSEFSGGGRQDARCAVSVCAAQVPVSGPYLLQQVWRKQVCVVSSVCRWSRVLGRHVWACAAGSVAWPGVRSGVCAVVGEGVRLEAHSRTDPGQRPTVEVGAGVVRHLPAPKALRGLLVRGGMYGFW